MRITQRARHGHTLIEPVVAIVLLAAGALGGAAVLAHAAAALARSAHQRRARDATAVLGAEAASAPCGVGSRGVALHTVRWIDSSAGRTHVRTVAGPCAR